MNEEQRHPWQPEAYTGIGSWPGTDPGEAIRTILGELPHLPHLPELPGRGPGADMIGRTG
ncbi:MAG TPA: methionine synthase, partial [Acidobacteriota bacterium]|nr:methionine synthase [Acidobacteriota bacterium]